MVEENLNMRNLINKFKKNMEKWDDNDGLLKEQVENIFFNLLNSDTIVISGDTYPGIIDIFEETDLGQTYDKRKINRSFKGKEYEYSYQYDISMTDFISTVSDIADSAGLSVKRVGKGEYKLS